MHHCKYMCINGEMYHRCQEAALKKDPYQEDCEFYQRSNDKIDPEFCRHSFDSDGMATDECLCRGARAQSREDYEKPRNAERA